MTRTLLLAPTGHGVGLTSVCLGLVHGLEQRGVKVGFLKPLAQPRVDRARKSGGSPPATRTRPLQRGSVGRRQRVLARDREAVAILAEIKTVQTHVPVEDHGLNLQALQIYGEVRQFD